MHRMRITTKGTNFTFTPDVVSYLEKKLEKLEDLIDKKDTTAIADIEIEHDLLHTAGEIYTAEITITCSAGQFRAEATEATPLAAIDVVEEEITKELRRAKGKKMRWIRLEGLRFKNFLRGFPWGRGKKG